MSVCRATVFAEVLEPGMTHRSGVLDNGTQWGFDEVTIIDADRNKVQLRVRNGVHVPVGPAVLEVDFAVKGQSKAIINGVRQAAPAAASSK